VQRLSTIQNADVIFVLDGGRIVEQGDHASLVKKRGVYWQMVGVPILEDQLCFTHEGRYADLRWGNPLVLVATFG